MLMRGDLNKIIEQFNGIFESIFERLQAVEDKLHLLEEETPVKPQRKQAVKKDEEEKEAA